MTRILFAQNIQHDSQRMISDFADDYESSTNGGTIALAYTATSLDQHRVRQAADVHRKQNSSFQTGHQRKPWYPRLQSTHRMLFIQKFCGLELPFCTVLAQHGVHLLKDGWAWGTPKSVQLCLQNLAAWAVAGTAAYLLWVKPEQTEQQKRVQCQPNMPCHILSNAC